MIDTNVNTLLAVCELLEKHGTVDVLGALIQFTETLKEHAIDHGHGASVERGFERAIHDLSAARMTLVRLENSVGVTLYDASEVLIGCMCVADVEKEGGL